jgi:thiol-disulfide isomerase/thioredoxin
MILSVVLSASLTATANAQTQNLTLLSKGAMPKMGGYRPIRATLSDQKPATLHKAPEGLTAPLYGVLPIGPEGSKQVFHIIIDEPDGKPAALYIDANGNGDLTDDEPAEWKPKTSKNDDGKELTQYNGGATLQIAYGEKKVPVHLGMYRFDKNDPGREALKKVVLYYCDYAYEGEVELAGKKYKAMLTDDSATGDFRGKALKTGHDAPPAEDQESGVRLRVDVNGNGKFDTRGESFDIRKPFNIGGTTYEVADMDASGASFKIVKSSATVAEVATPPDHSVGKKITPFKAKTMDGKAVEFPGSYRGKVVMVDFWATWCGPCMKEVPNLVKVYDEFHGKGFEVLGVTLDQKDAEEKVKSVTGEHKMTWPQIYDGKFWKAEIAQLYAVDSIPRAYLVDGDSGEILANPDQLRGETLKGVIEKALEKKHASQKN